MIGHTLGHFRVVERLGEGGMGEVFRGIDEMLDRDVAMKMLRPELAHRADVVERFRAEAVTLARLDHPNIAHLYGMVQADPHRIMVMEFVPGETLAACVERKGRMPWRDAVGAMLQLLDGLEYAHGRGVVHRDIKPANLIVRPDGRLKITDFGIARVLGTSRATRTGFMVGTLEYMAPEQIRGEDAGERTDLYAAGIVFYQLLTGRVPFSATTEFELMRLQLEAPVPSVRPLASDVPDWLDEVIRLALTKDPAQRTASASDFRDALSTRMAAEPQSARVKATRLAAGPVAATRVAQQVSPDHRVASLIRRKPFITAAALVVAGAAALSPFAYRALRTKPAIAPTSVATASPAVEVEQPQPLVPAPSRRASTEPATPAPRPRRDTSVPPAPPVVIPPAAPVEFRTPPPATPPASRRVVERADAMFERESLVVIEGKKTHERDIILRFSGGDLQLIDRKTRVRISTMALASIDSATYSRSKQPRWKTASAGVVLGGIFASPLFFLKGTQHWLTLEGEAAPLVIRLDKNSWERVLAEIELRSSIKVAKPAASAP